MLIFYTPPPQKKKKSLSKTAIYIYSISAVQLFHCRRLAAGFFFLVTFFSKLCKHRETCLYISVYNYCKCCNLECLSTLYVLFPSRSRNGQILSPFLRRRVGYFRDTLVLSCSPEIANMMFPSSLLLVDCWLMFRAVHH